MKEERSFDDLFDDFVHKEMDDFDCDSEMDVDFENQLMKELEPYTSKGVTYYIPRKIQPEYSFRWLELEAETEQLDSRKGKTDMVLSSDKGSKPVLKAVLNELYILDNNQLPTAGVVLLLYRVGSAYPLIVRSQKMPVYNDSVSMFLSDINERWESGEYFLLVVNAQCEESSMESHWDVMSSHMRYSFSLLEDGKFLEHPSIKDFSLSLDKKVELVLEGTVGKLDKFRLVAYNSEWLWMAETDELSLCRGKLKARLYGTGFWLEGDYSLIVIHNGEPCSLVTFHYKKGKVTNSSWSHLDMLSPYYMLGKYMDKDTYWNRLSSIPGCCSLRKAMVERYGHKVLNEWRKAHLLSKIEQRTHFSIATLDGCYDAKLVKNVVELLNPSMEYKEGDCELLVENKNSVDPYEDMRGLLDGCFNTVICLHHLSALITSPNGKVFMHMLEKKLQSNHSWVLVLVGTQSEICQLVEESSVVGRLITVDNRFHTEPYSVQEQLRFLNSYISDMQFTLSPKAMKKMMDLVIANRELMSSWRKEELKQWWAKGIYPRFMKRILSIKNMDNAMKTLHVLEPEDLFLEAMPSRKDEFAESVQELNAMVGLDNLKRNMTTLFNRSRFEKMRRNMGLPILEKGGYHMIFTGNPGTGKTTVAKLVGKIYHSLGLLSKGGVVMTERTKLVGRYIGETEKNMVAVLEQAKGNVLFIDEAYSLCDNTTGDRRDFGCRVLESLLTVLAQKNPDMIVIMAGYEKEMEQMLEMNPGMKGRFPYKFNFDDYNAEELYQIALKLLKCSEYVLTPEADALLKVTIQETVLRKDSYFHNARWVEQYMMDGVVSAMSDRLMSLPFEWENKDLLRTIEVQDIEMAYQKMKLHSTKVEAPKRRIGFVA